MKLLMKNGDIKNFKLIRDGVYISNRSFDLFMNYEFKPLYYEVDGCALLLGQMRKSFFDQITKEMIDDKVKIYKDNLIACINNENTNGAHELYTSSYEYINKLLNVSEQKFIDFKKSYENQLEEKRIAREKKYAEELESERLEEIARIENIKNNILNDVVITGRDLLDVMINLDINCPIKTKGMINRCYNLASNTANINGKIPPKNSIENIFKWYRVVKNHIQEELEYDNLDEDSKAEIENLFKK